MRTAIGTTLDFAAGGNAAEHTVRGWAAAEPGHTWTLGAESTLCLPAPEAPLGYFLELTWFPFVVPPLLGGQPLTIRVNGERVFGGEAAAEQIIAVRCPPPARGTRWLVVTFEHPDAARPADFGRNDTRELALAFRWLRVLPILELPPARVPPGAGAPASHERITGGAAADMSAQAERLAGVPLAALLAGFEMLAGNCDMGTAQRALGCNPLSLLRFAGSYPAVSIRGLDTGFAGIGEALEPWRGDGDEWMMRDRYGLNYHTGQRMSEVGEERLIEMEHKRVRFLLRKFLDDVAEGDKIFVADRTVGTTLAGVLPLYLALWRHGPRRLLWVVQAPDRDRGGLAREVLPGLVHAQLWPFAAPMAGHVSVPGWLEVMVNTWRLAGRQAAAAAA